MRPVSTVTDRTVSRQHLLHYRRGDDRRRRSHQALELRIAASRVVMPPVAVLRLSAPVRLAAARAEASVDASRTPSTTPATMSQNPPARASSSVADVRRMFVEYHDFVWRTLLYLGVPRALVDDATQDVFLVVHRRFSAFDRTRSGRSWLYGIARRVASGYRRAGRNASKHFSPETPRDVGDEGQRTHERIEAVDLIERFLARLDEGKRRVFLLAELEGMSAPEIARALDLNVNTVYARLRAARRRLAVALDAEPKPHEEGPPCPVVPSRS